MAAVSSMRRTACLLKETLNKLIPFMPFDKLRRAFDKPVLSRAEGFTTNGINPLPFVLSLSKDLIRASLMNETCLQEGGCTGRRLNSRSRR